MEDDEINVLEAMLDNLIVNVFGHNDRLLAQTEIQDVKVKQIWKAYSRLGYTFPQYSEKLLGPIVISMREAKSDEPFFEAYRQTHEELDKILSLLKQQNNPLEVLQQGEQLINDLLILLHFQWEKLVEKFPPIVKKVRAVRDAEIALMADFRVKKPELKKDPSFAEIEASFAWEQQQLAAEQLQLFLKEKEILDELQKVADKREGLLKLSEELFLR